MDDGIRAGLLTLEQLAEIPLVARQVAQVMHLYPQISGRRRVHETVRRMVNELVVDVIQRSVEQLREARPADIEAVRRHERPLIGMSPPDAGRAPAAQAVSEREPLSPPAACCA